MAWNMYRSEKPRENMSSINTDEKHSQNLRRGTRISPKETNEKKEEGGNGNGKKQNKT